MQIISVLTGRVFPGQIVLGGILHTPPFTQSVLTSDCDALEKPVLFSCKGRDLIEVEKKNVPNDQSSFCRDTVTRSLN